MLLITSISKIDFFFILRKICKREFNWIQFLESTPWNRLCAHIHIHAVIQVCLWFICVTLHIISYGMRMNKKMTPTTTRNTHEFENASFFLSHKYIIYKTLHSLWYISSVLRTFFWLNEFFNLNSYECYQVGVHVHFHRDIHMHTHIEHVRMWDGTFFAVLWARAAIFDELC